MRILPTLLVVMLGLELAGCAAAPEAPVHRLVVHVDDNDPARMNLALNNIANVYGVYQKKGEEIQVELVAYGPGLHMLRADTSPVKERVTSLKQNFENVSVVACGNTKTGMEKAEGKAVTLLPGVSVVPAGVPRIMERQEQGWAYLRP